jgi:hypothetical protein
VILVHQAVQCIYLISEIVHLLRIQIHLDKLWTFQEKLTTTKSFLLSDVRKRLQKPDQWLFEEAEKESKDENIFFFIASTTSVTIHFFQCSASVVTLFECISVHNASVMV